jgi:hypothetical protein
MSNQDDELLAAIAAEPAQPVGDLTRLRKNAKELRDLYLVQADLQEKIKTNQAKITQMERRTLPDMFSEAKISALVVEQDGNHQPFIAERKTVYTAKIPDDKRPQAFQWFVQNDHGDLVKSVITIKYGMQEHDKKLAAMELLNKHKIKFDAAESVHHSTLKAFVEREITAGHVIPHDLLGVSIFDEIKIK